MSGINSIGDAVRGIHGVGGASSPATIVQADETETIRGTFNKGVDQAAAESFKGDSSTNKDHLANNDKHDATLQRGQNEIQNAERAL